MIESLDLNECVMRIGDAKRNDIGKYPSIFHIVNVDVLVTLDSTKDYMNMTYEETLINLFNHMMIQFGERKTKEWIKKILREWEMIDENQ